MSTNTNTNMATELDYGATEPLRDDVRTQREAEEYVAMQQLASSLLGQLLDHMGAERFAEVLVAVMTVRADVSADVIRVLVDAWPTAAAECVVAYGNERDDGPLIRVLVDALVERSSITALLREVAMRWGDVDDWCDLHPKYDADKFLKDCARDMSVDEWCDLHRDYEPGIPSGDVAEAVEHLDDVIDTLERAKRLLNGE